MSNHDYTPDQGRKPYQKPQVERVRLVAEEAVLAVCKLGDSFSASGNTANCTSPNFGTPCTDLSS